MRKIILLLSFSLLGLAMFAQTGLEGVWYNTDKTGKVEIYKKGEAYYGKIIWLKEPLSPTTGKPKVDENNPESSKRTAPIIGLIVLKNFTFEGDKVYSGGTIYDPENGKTYKCKMTLLDKDHLDVRGYIGVPALGRTENWTRSSK